MNTIIKNIYAKFMPNFCAKGWGERKEVLSI